MRDRARTDAGPDKRSYRVSFEKIRRDLPEFKPQWDARAGAEQLYKAYRSSGLTLEEFEGPRYQRIGHIRTLIGQGILDPDIASRPARTAKQYQAIEAIMQSAEPEVKQVVSATSATRSMRGEA